MPRLPRIDIPGVPQHVVQRGNDRGPCFFMAVDRLRYVDELTQITRRAVKNRGQSALFRPPKPGSECTFWLSNLSDLRTAPHRQLKGTPMC